MDSKVKNSSFLPLHHISISKEEEKEVIPEGGSVIASNSTDIDRPRHNTWAKKLFARSVEVRGVLQLTLDSVLFRLITCQVYRQCPRTNGSDTRTAKLFLCGSQ